MRIKKMVTPPLLKIAALVLSGLLLLITACESNPTFVNHPEPDLTVDFEAFNDAGCPKNASGIRVCKSDSPLAAYGCDEIREPSSLIGGLTPSYPIATCVVHLVPGTGRIETSAETRAEIEKRQYFYNAGGMLPAYIRYVILRDGGFQLIKTEDEFRDIYAPIESPEEALGYVLAVKYLSAYYGLEKNPDFVYNADTIEDTYVTSESAGYRLHLYFYEVFGCGSHWTSVVEIHLSREGIIREISRTPVFRDPDEDGMCVD